MKRLTSALLAVLILTTVSCASTPDERRVYAAAGFAMAKEVMQTMREENMKAEEYIEYIARFPRGSSVEVREITVDGGGGDVLYPTVIAAIHSAGAVEVPGETRFSSGRNVSNYDDDGPSPVVMNYLFGNGSIRDIGRAVIGDTTTNSNNPSSAAATSEADYTLHIKVYLLETLRRGSSTDHGFFDGRGTYNSRRSAAVKVSLIVRDASTGRSIPGMTAESVMNVSIQEVHSGRYEVRGVDRERWAVRGSRYPAADAAARLIPLMFQEPK